MALKKKQLKNLMVVGLIAAVLLLINFSSGSREGVLAFTGVVSGISLVVLGLGIFFIIIPEPATTMAGIIMVAISGGILAISAGVFSAQLGGLGFLPIIGIAIFLLFIMLRRRF